jgi:phosphate transport system substrate-binding protein
MSLKNNQTWKLSILFLIVVLIGGCGLFDSLRPIKTQAVLIGGSQTFVDFAAPLIKAFNQKHPNIFVANEGGGSTSGIIAVKKGAIDIGSTSRKLTADEEDPYIKTIAVAKDGMAILVNPKNPVKNLTIEQIADIFTGKIVNWKEVGGNDLPIQVVSRKVGSKTLRGINDIILQGRDFPANTIITENHQTMVQVVNENEKSIGFLSSGDWLDTAHPVSINNVAMSKATIINEQYPLVRNFYLFTSNQPTDAAKEVLNFIFSPEGQKILTEQGLINVSSLSIEGSETFDQFLEPVLKEFNKKYPSILISYRETDSTNGIAAAARESVDIGASTRKLTTEENNGRIVVTPIAKDGIAIIVNPNNPVKNITDTQAQDILTGVIINWRAVSGKDAPVQVITRKTGSKTLVGVNDMIMFGRPFPMNAIVVDSHIDMVKKVGEDGNAVGFLSSGDWQKQAVSLAINGIQMSNAAIINDTYPFTRSFYLLTVPNSSKNAELFIKFVLSSEGQAIIKSSGLISNDEIRATLSKGKK